MRIPLLEALQSRVLVANGAMGTVLAAKGLNLKNSTLANFDHAAVLGEICRGYRAVGAEVFQSNTFAATETMLRHAGLEDRHDEANRLGLRLVREAVGEDAYVAANFGPTGELLRPLGLMTAAEAQAVYRRQAEVLLAEEPDFVLLETFEALDELEVAVAGIREAGCAVPLAITFSFSQASGRSMMGVSPEQALAKMVELGADLVGANCGLPGVTLEAVQTMGALTDLPLIIQANAGVPEIRGGETVFSGTPEEAAALAVAACAAGARIVGGCCGTNSTHIAAIAAAVGGLS